MCAYASEILRYNYKVVYYQVLLRLPQEIALILQLEKIVEKHVYQALVRSGSENTKQNDELYIIQKELGEIPSPELMTVGIILQNYAADTLAGGDEGVLKLDPIIQDYLYERAWTLKDKPKEIHTDFGKLSFHADKELKKEYHCSLADKMRVVFELLNNLEQA